MKIAKRAALIVAAAALAAGASAGTAVADSSAVGAATHSSGILSGNVVQIPVHIPINACGNTVSIVGLLNPAIGNVCSNA